MKKSEKINFFSKRSTEKYSVGKTVKEKKERRSPFF